MPTKPGTTSANSTNPPSPGSKKQTTTAKPDTTPTPASHPSLQRLLTLTEQTHGTDHTEVTTTLTNLGNAWIELGQPDQARDLLQRALTINEREYGPHHREIANTLNNLGAAWKGLGEPGKARDLHERALTINEREYGPHHLEVANTLNNLGAACRGLGEPGKALPLYERALSIAEQEYGPNHCNVAVTLNNLGTAWRDLGKPDTALPLFERSLTIAEQEFGPNHSEVANTLNNLGNAWTDLGEPGKARALYERTLTIERRVYGPDHSRLAGTLNNLGNAYRDLGEPGKALPLYLPGVRASIAARGGAYTYVATDPDVIHKTSDVYDQYLEQYPLLVKTILALGIHTNPPTQPGILPDVSLDLSLAALNQLDPHGFTPVQLDPDHAHTIMRTHAPPLARENPHHPGIYTFRDERHINALTTWWTHNLGRNPTTINTAINQAAHAFLNTTRDGLHLPETRESEITAAAYLTTTATTNGRDTVSFMDLVGSHRLIVDDLRNRLDRITVGEDQMARVVLLEAAPGEGKTRIARELYGRLQTSQTEPNYWPALIEADDPFVTRKEPGPSIDGFVWSAHAIPEFTWWHIQGNQHDPVSTLTNQAAHLLPARFAYKYQASSLKERAKLKQLLTRLRDTLGTDTLERVADNLGEQTEIASDLANALGFADLALPGVGSLTRYLFRGLQALDRDAQHHIQLRTDSHLGDRTETGQLKRFTTMLDQLTTHTLTQTPKRAGLPTVIVVEDLHLLTERLLNTLLDHITNLPRARPVLLIGTTYPTGHHPALTDWQTSNPTASHTIDVQPLTQAERIELLRQAAPNTHDTDATQLTTALSNPLDLLTALYLPAVKAAIAACGGAYTYVTTDPDVIHKTSDVYDQYLEQYPLLVKTVLALGIHTSPPIRAGILPDVSLDLSLATLNHLNPHGFTPEHLAPNHVHATMRQHSPPLAREDPNHHGIYTFRDQRHINALATWWTENLDHAHNPDAVKTAIHRATHHHIHTTRTGLNLPNTRQSDINAAAYLDTQPTITDRPDGHDTDDPVRTAALITNAHTHADY